MTVDTTKLRELAQAATPGPWYSKWPEERCVWKDLGPGRNRATNNPGGCECENCGCIFIGGPEHSVCGDCFAAYEEEMRKDERRSEWHAEMRRDAFGD